MTIEAPQPISARRAELPTIGARRAELPPIGIWWPMLEPTLQREILEHPSAPLRRAVVRRIYELCELERFPMRDFVRLNENERAYLAGWTHTAAWE
ncbi:MULTISPECIES: hypothetical protein [Agromyces]|jgi:hypothetical protein|uniref:Uncharacterized protein n=1 Tax=Agromyces mediolanus TaxID=41986 RepID=A0A918C9P6_AGRME|nr:MULTISPECIES: hypothetical protein [Agromyces]GGR13933.1 hypothetical protein GCM10010196_03110 [Agromyces mediolanus]GLJ72715.1 hypothetical protein GCM10017583_19710 [Agromyces mediolanus]GLU88848.1 hypothetical protein Agsp01_11030 [Agromyces sp. NBRC 114283]